MQKLSINQNNFIQTILILHKCINKQERNRANYLLITESLLYNHIYVQTINELLLFLLKYTSMIKKTNKNEPTQLQFLCEIVGTYNLPKHHHKCGSQLAQLYKRVGEQKRENIEINRKSQNLMQYKQLITSECKSYSVFSLVQESSQQISAIYLTQELSKSHFQNGADKQTF